FHGPALLREGGIEGRGVLLQGKALSIRSQVYRREDYPRRKGNIQPLRTAMKLSIGLRLALPVAIG
ncbi:MAG TPA: hypothetical protein VLE46_10255, partial [Nitrospira sp.]|nr:hypothetical protein [Nitrospira sp.]